MRGRSLLAVAIGACAVPCVTRCQAFFADPTVAVDAGADVTSDVSSDTGCNTCPAQLFEDDPGPTLVRAGKDEIFFAMTGDTYDGSRREIWSVPKSGGEAKKLDVVAYAVAGQVVGDDFFVLDPHGVVRLSASTPAKWIFTNTTNGHNRQIAVRDDTVFWLGREDGVRSVLTIGGAATSVVSAGENGSYALAAGPDRIVFGIDAVVDLQANKLLDAGAIVEKKDGALVSKVLKNVPALVTDAVKLGDRYFVTTHDSPVTPNNPNRLYIWDGSTLTDKPLPFAIAYPTRLVVAPPFLYLSDAGGFGKKVVGGIWRYDPAKDEWSQVLSAIYPFIDVDETNIYFTEQVEPYSGSGPIPLHRRLRRVPR